MIIFFIIIIAGFGLSATIHAQTIERQKEIGIMKAIGASKKKIKKIITLERIIITLISFIIATLISIMSSYIFVFVFGNIIGISITFNIISYFISSSLWLLLSIIVGYLASRKIAKRAANQTAKSILLND
ncbi:MAG: FtsX-like permease family protein [Coprobacillaceae bacterium]